MGKPFPSLQSIHTVAIDFDGVFTDNKVWVNEDGVESVKCDRRDGLAFDFVRVFKKRGKLDAEFFILSKEPNRVVLARARKLGLVCHHSIDNKLIFLEDYLRRKIPSAADPFDGLVYLGNDLNDLAVMERAGFSAAPADAHPRVREAANVVFEENGGEGFVRAFIERLLEINQLSNEEINELISDR